MVNGSGRIIYDEGGGKRYGAKKIWREERYGGKKDIVRLEIWREKRYSTA